MANTGKLNLVQSAGKSVDGGKREKRCNNGQARENAQLVKSTRKLATGGKHGETSTQWQARENKQLVQSARKHLTSGVEKTLSKALIDCHKTSCVKLVNL